MNFINKMNIIQILQKKHIRLIKKLKSYAQTNYIWINY